MAATVGIRSVQRTCVFTSLSESRLTSRAVFMMLKRVAKDEARRGVAA